MWGFFQYCKCILFLMTFLIMFYFPMAYFKNMEYDTYKKQSMYSLLFMSIQSTVGFQQLHFGQSKVTDGLSAAWGGAGTFKSPIIQGSTVHISRCHLPHIQWTHSEHCISINKIENSIFSLLRRESNGSVKIITISNVLVVSSVSTTILRQFYEIGTSIRPTVQIRKLIPNPQEDSKRFTEGKPAIK